jgi:hypothetical protein
MNKKIKIALIGMAVGYAISEFLTVRRAYKKIRSATEHSTERHRYKWAAQMVLNEVHRGKYDHCKNKEEVKSSMDADFVYYQRVAHILNISG